MSIERLKELGSIEEQIDYLNNRISNGETVKEVYVDLGIPRDRYREYIKNNGYAYNQKEKIYKPSTNVETKNKHVENEQNNISNKTFYNNSTPVEPITNTSGSELPDKVYNSREIVVDKEEYKIMLKSFKEIEKMNEKLEAVYKWYEKEHEVIDVTPQELKIGKFEGEAVSRAYKFYPDIQRDFIEFCKKHKQYKSQDIICQALKEFMDKYK